MFQYGIDCSERHLFDRSLSFSRRVRDTTNAHCALVVVVVGGLHRRFSGGAHGFSP